MPNDASPTHPHIPPGPCLLDDLADFIETLRATQQNRDDKWVYTTTDLAGDGWAVIIQRTHRAVEVAP